MKLLIWGTGALTQTFVKYRFMDFTDLIGFIDTTKRVNEFSNLPVYLPEEILNIDFDRILVCVLKNNKEILDKVKSLCIEEEKVFFLHNAECFNGVNLKLYNDHLEVIKKEYPLIYNYIQGKVNQFEYINSDVKIENKLTDNSLICRNDDFVTAKIPIELLFSEKRKDNGYVQNITKEWELLNSLYQDIPLIAFEPYRNLYQFFSTGKCLPIKYCNWFQNLFLTRNLKSGYTDESLIEKRYLEYKIMKHNLQINGLTFFIEHPAVGKWNENGYFNLLDGHHRVSFLYDQGFRLIPVCIKYDDYKKWTNKNSAEKVKNIILCENRTEFYQPILNPYFLNLHPHRDDVCKSRLQIILEYMGMQRYAGKKVIDIGANIGYFGAAFSRMGADVTFVECDPFHYKLLNELLKLQNIKGKVIEDTFESYDTKDRFDIAILLTVLYHQMKDKDICEKFIKKLNTNVSDMLIWESGENVNEEKELIINKTKFKNYKHLAYTYATGKFRELGVFTI